MRFEFTDEQMALEDAVNSFLSAHCTPAIVRAAWSAPAASLDRTVW
jgi:hypothetical protein